MDTYDVFSTTILHEMMHTHQGGRLEDVGRSKAYGWKNVVKMSSVNSVKNAGANPRLCCGSFVAVMLINHRFRIHLRNGNLIDQSGKSASIYY